MSNDTQKADQIAFHFYTKLFYVLNQARETAEPRSQSKVDKWFNLETPDSDLFTKEAREPYKNISLAPPPGPPPLEIQVLLAVPELTNNQVLVYLTPDSSRRRIEPTPRFILLESWLLSFIPRRTGEDSSIDVALPTIYKHGIPLFRSLFSLLRILPTWKLYKRLKRRTGGVVRNGHLGIQLRVRSNDGDEDILQFHTPPSPSLSTPLPTQSHVFSSVPHPLGSLTLSTTYLSTPDFQLEELESVLSSRFISQDLDAGEGFVPTLIKNHQRDSITGSSLPSSSGIRSVLSRSPPKSIGRTVSTGSDSMSVAERFIIPARTASTPGSGGSTSAGTGTRHIAQPARQLATPPSGLAVTRLRKESLNSSPSSSLSTRDLPSVPHAVNPALSSLSSSPSSVPLPIRRPNINLVHPFKSNTVSSASGSSPSLSIRQGVVGGGSPLSTAGIAASHSRSGSAASSAAAAATTRHPPSPIGIGFTGPGSRPSPPMTFAPSSLGEKRPGTSGSGGSGGSDRDRRISMTNLGVGDGISDEGRGTMPPRKRYSSSFGHRYVGSVGSVGGGTGLGGSGEAAPNSGRSTPANQAAGTGLGIDEGSRERKESAVGGVASFLSSNTDDDDISIFVQDIDARKPLSGRTKEREKRDREKDRERQQRWFTTADEDSPVRGQGHDREVADTTNKGKERERDDSRQAYPLSLGLATAATSPTISSPPSATSITSRQGSHSTVTAARLSTSPPLPISMSPSRGPMLTSQVEVEERLRKMNETFLKSLEGISGGAGSIRRKEREKKKEKEKARSSRQNSDEQPQSASRGDVPSTSGRGLGQRRERDRGSDEHHARTSTHPYSLGMGLRRSNNDSTGNLSQSEGVSQGSEEVIGRMDLYEERRRSGYQS